MENIENIPQSEEQQAPATSEIPEQVPVTPEPVCQMPPAAEPAAEAPIPKKASGGLKVFKATIAILLVVAAVLGGCGATAFVMSRHWNEQHEQTLTALKLQQLQIKALEAQNKELRKEVESNSFTGNGNSISGSPTPVEGLSPAQVHAQNKNSVVGIANQGVTTNIFGQVTETASSGSGFIVSEDGYIVTNHHVIEGAKTLTVITNNEEEYNAKVVGYDEDNDFALIKIDVTGLTPVKLGKSDDLIVGDQVVAIGNPLGEITNSLTVGYISVKDRDVAIDNTIINMLQTDTAINPGNSGGPLFNMKGEVIGITTAKYSGTAVESIGFAIPIDDVAQMIDELIEFGYISAPYMGVQITKQTDGIGVYVALVEENSPAAKAGLKKGDIIVALGEYETSTLSKLDKALRNFEPNDTVTIQVYRNRTILDLTITFGSKYPQNS